MRESTRVITGAPRQIAAAEVFASQALLRGSRRGTQVCGIDQRRRSRLLAALDEIGATRVQDARTRTHGIANAAQNRDRLGRCPVVVAEQRHDLVGGRPDDGQRLDIARQRQHAVVLQQHDRGLSGAPRQAHRAPAD